jgi:excisionase family DNA binding protein
MLERRAKMDKLYTTKEVAEILKVTVNTIKLWLREGRLKGTKIGKSWRINEDDLRMFAPITPTKEESKAKQFAILKAAAERSERELYKHMEELQQRYGIEEGDSMRLLFLIEEIGTAERLLYKEYYSA